MLGQGDASVTIIGTAGDGMDGDTSWAANADVVRVGRDGEQRTGRLLDAFARKHPGVAILHNLQPPHPRVRINIDHVVVTGRTVHVVDSKVWRRGFYWTFGSRSFCGIRRDRHAEKRTVQIATESIERLLTAQGIRGRVREGLVVVWPGKGSKASRFWALRVPGAKAVPAHRFARSLRRRFGTTPAEPQIVSALAALRDDW